MHPVCARVILHTGLLTDQFSFLFWQLGDPKFQTKAIPAVQKASKKQPVVKVRDVACRRWKQFACRLFICSGCGCAAPQGGKAVPFRYCF